MSHKDEAKKPLKCKAKKPLKCKECPFKGKGKTLCRGSKLTARKHPVCARYYAKIFEYISSFKPPTNLRGI